MQTGDYGERRSEPWTYSRNTLPIRTYSLKAMSKSGKGKTLRARYKRKKNYFKIEDAERIMSKILPPEGAQEESWALHVIRVLRAATMQMLGRILWMLPEGRIQDLYDFCIDLLDKFFGVMPLQESATKIAARGLIINIADRAGISVTFPE